MQPPAKLVIRGVPPDTPLYHAVANAYAGRLKSFHAKAQQSYSLSNNEASKQRFDWGDGARATYTNLSGQEIIELEVSVTILSEFSEAESEEFTPWDWVILDVQVPDWSYGIYLAAFMIVPVLDPLTAADPKGVTTRVRGGGHGYKPISFPDASNTDFQLLGSSTISGDYDEGSLLVDLNVVERKSAVVVDVYGELVYPTPPCATQRVSFPAVYRLTMPANPPAHISPDTSPCIDDYAWNVVGRVQYRNLDCVVSSFPFYVGSFSTNYGGGPLPATFTFTHVTTDSASDEILTFTVEAVRSGTQLKITVSCDKDVVTAYQHWTAGWTTNSVINNDGWWSLTVVGSDGATDGSGWIEDTFSSSANVQLSNPSQSGPAAESHDFLPWTRTTVPGWVYNPQLSYTYFFVPYLTQAPDPSVDPDNPRPAASREATIKGLIGRGSPQWSYANRTDDIVTFSQWELKELYDRQPPVATLKDNVPIATAPDGVTDTSISNHYGLTKLGTMIADRKTGALTFTKA